MPKPNRHNFKELSLMSIGARPGADLNKELRQSGLMDAIELRVKGGKSRRKAHRKAHRKSHRKSQRKSHRKSHRKAHRRH